MDHDTLKHILTFLDPASVARLKLVFKPFPKLYPIISVIESGDVVIVDEEGASLHPMTYAVEENIPKLMAYLVSFSGRYLADFVRLNNAVLLLEILPHMRHSTVLDILYKAIQLDAIDLIEVLYEEGIVSADDIVSEAFHIGNADIAHEYIERAGLE